MVRTVTDRGCLFPFIHSCRSGLLAFFLPLFQQIPGCGEYGLIKLAVQQIHNIPGGILYRFKNRRLHQDLVRILQGSHADTHMPVSLRLEVLLND